MGKALRVVDGAKDTTGPDAMATMARLSRIPNGRPGAALERLAKGESRAAFRARAVLALADGNGIAEA